MSLRSSVCLPLASHSKRDRWLEMADADAAYAHKLTPLIKTHDVCEAKVTELAQGDRGVLSWSTAHSSISS